MRGTLFLVNVIRACAAQRLPVGPILLRQIPKKRLWFRNDLRLTDNAALQTAASMIREKQAVEVSRCLFSALKR